MCLLTTQLATQPTPTGPGYGVVSSSIAGIVVYVWCKGYCGGGGGYMWLSLGAGGLFFADPYIVSWLYVVSCRLFS